MSEVVTKSKNEGRVAAGKRLAEWNRKNKENLVKNKEQVETSTSSSASEVNSSAGEVPTSQTSSQAALYGGGAAIALALGIAIVFLWKRTPQALTKNSDASSGTAAHDDIFRMI